MKIFLADKLTGEQNDPNFNVFVRKPIITLLTRKW